MKRTLLISRKMTVLPCALNSAVIAELPVEGSCDVDIELWTPTVRGSVMADPQLTAGSASFRSISSNPCLMRSANGLLQAMIPAPSLRWDAKSTATDGMIVPAPVAAEQ